MGIVHPGTPHHLTLFLRDALGLDTFIETGTQYGHSAGWAAQHFPTVHSVELSPVLWQRACVTLRSLSNVTVHQGSSPEVLARLLKDHLRPALFWLDAHWSLGETAGEDAPCPLLAELEVVLTQPVAHTLLIDDARLFCAPPALPHPASAWPSLAALTHTLARLGRGEYFLFEDVIIVPAPADVELVRKYLQLADTRASQSPLRQAVPLPAELATPLAAAETALRDGNAEHALAAALALTDAAQGSEQPVLLAARAAHALGRLDDALNYFTQAAKLSPTLVAPHAERAAAAHAAGQAATARDAAEWAMAAGLEAALALGCRALRGDL